MEKHCSFCGREENHQLPIIEGAEANICKECAETCVEEIQVTSQAPVQKGLKPHEIKAELDKYVMGQEEAKKLLAVAVYNHYKRIDSKSKVDIQKTNILITGPTGSGKTHVIQTLAKILDVPLVIADANSLTQAGYVGEDVETILEKLIIKAKGDIRKAERGIVYIDEIDKIASYQVEGRKHSKDISGQAVQESLLKIIEDSEVHLMMSGGNPHAKQRVIINTKNILFICGGAFVGLDDIIKKRTSGTASKTIGFTTSASQSTTTVKPQEKEVLAEDLISFGFIPEFVGRIPVVASLNPLTKEDLMDILLKSKNAVIKQYQALLKMDGVKLTFHKGAVEYVAEEALKKKVGARGLKGILEKKMYDLMFLIPQYKGVDAFLITKEMMMGSESMIPSDVPKKEVG